MNRFLSLISYKKSVLLNPSDLSVQVLDGTGRNALHPREVLWGALAKWSG